MIEPNLNRLFVTGFSIAAKALVRTRTEALCLLDKNFNSSFLDIEDLKKIPGPIMFFSTHSSWWDPLLAAEICLNKLSRKAIAPMDQKQLEHYKSLKNVGVFGVEKGDARAAAAVVSAFWNKNINGAVWITPQGSFALNEKPQPEFKPGVSQWSKLGNAKVSNAAVTRVGVVLHYVPSCWSSKMRVYISFQKADPLKSNLESDAESLRKHLTKQAKATVDYAKVNFDKKTKQLEGVTLI